MIQLTTSLEKVEWTIILQKEKEKRWAVQPRSENILGLLY